MIHIINGAYLASFLAVLLVAHPRTRKPTLWSIAGLLVVAAFTVRFAWSTMRHRERPHLHLPRRYRPVWVGRRYY